MDDDGTLTSWLFSSSLSSSTTLLAWLATFTILFASGIYWFWIPKNQRQTVKATTNTTTTTTTTTPSKTASSTSSNATHRLQNVWDTPSQSSMSLSSNQRNNNNGNNKPFGSSYYYAHNNPNAKGGYKDGLKMEDYTMNGPRLLSKGGKPVDNTTSITTSIDVDDKNAMDKENDQPTEMASSDDVTAPFLPNQDDVNLDQTRITTTSSTIPIRSITKYLWDDPGDSNGIATIRIDVLPALLSTSTNMMEWSSVVIDKVEVELVGPGMAVRVHSQSPLARYELKIPQLYGEAESIQAIVKPKRLLIKIIKKKQQSSRLFSFKHANSNLDAWPQPHRKV